MNYEEKYKEALEKAQIYRNHLIETGDNTNEIEYIFPELAESEDEKIRKTLIDLVNGIKSWNYFLGISREQMISWLEKQSNKKQITDFSNIKTWKSIVDAVLTKEKGIGQYLDSERTETIAKELLERFGNIKQRYVLEKQDEQKHDVPDTPIKDSEVVTSRMKYIDENLKPIAEFVMDYASWDLRKDEWNHPVATVPLFRVLDALVQNGKQYSEEYSVVDNNTEPKFEVGDVMRTLQEAADNITGGLPVVVHIGKKYYHCTNELIAIKNQDDYEYPPTNRRQKPDVSLETKFKVGDWVVFKNMHQSIYQVETIEDGYYILRHIHGGTFRVCILHDENLRLWTIQDAKDGDVLSQDNIPFIFKRWDNNCIAYCGIIDYGLFEIVEDNFSWCNGINVNPATKEQRDKLEKAITEAGYKWNKEDLKLEKI